MSTPTIDELRQTIAFHREALTKAEAQLRDIEEPPHTRPMPRSEMIERALAFETRKSYKAEWKKVVDTGYWGLVENVQGILAEVRDYLSYTTECEPEFLEAARGRFGRKGSRQEQEFTLIVIKYLHDQGAFRDSYTGEFDNFGDTAGGCDEITQDAAYYVIEHPEMQLPRLRSATPPLPTREPSARLAARRQRNN